MEKLTFSHKVMTNEETGKKDLVLAFNVEGLVEYWNNHFLDPDEADMRLMEKEDKEKKITKEMVEANQEKFAAFIGKCFADEESIEDEDGNVTSRRMFLNELEKCMMKAYYEAV